MSNPVISVFLVVLQSSYFNVLEDVLNQLLQAFGALIAGFDGLPLLERWQERCLGKLRELAGRREPQS
jgi:hypothetical protein